MHIESGAKWWPILYQGRYARNGEPGIYVWRLRYELSEALDRFESNEMPLTAHQNKTAAGAQPAHSYWWLNANPKIWSFASMSVGETQSYTHFNENGNKRRIFQNFLDAKAGDLVIGYESYPVKQVVALAQIAAEQDGSRGSLMRPCGPLSSFSQGSAGGLLRCSRSSPLTA